jgi:two-component system chemotaxis response regulator CheB
MSPKRIRVLVVDDAVVIRKIVTDVLGEDPEIEVVGTAANGRIALQKITQVNPDILTLDVEMPEMDGLETLKQLRATYPQLPVIMFSTLTERGASTTIDALTLGASDYVTKPANIGSVSEAFLRLREQLVPKIKFLCNPKGATTTQAPLPRTTPPAIPQVRPAVTSPASAATGIEILAIGVSTGGPNALAAIIPQLPGNLPVPIVLVQHMPPMFTKFLADRLNAQSALTVVEARGGETLQPGHVYVAPGDYHMVVERKGASLVTALNQTPPENSCRPAVDVLFRSVAENYRAGTLAVVLTGMGQDGLRGCEDIKRVGGTVFAQDEATSVVWGMPGFVVRAGLADRVLALPDVAPEIARRISVRHSSPVLSVAAASRG